MTRTPASESRSYLVRGMDCAEEVAILKREVGPLVGGASKLRFDLINARMIIDYEEVADSEVKRAVAATGMEAIAWEDAEASDETCWQRRGRAVLSATSGSLLFIGFLLQVFVLGGVGAALRSELRHALPLWVILPYAGAVLAGGWFIFPKALFAARRFRPDMNLLMTIAVTGAVILGEWFEAGTVSFLFAIALLLESWSVGRARRAIQKLVALSPTNARYRCPTDGDIMTRPVSAVPMGSVVLVRPSEQVPLDGRVVAGSTTINQAPITGESTPVTKQIGDEVYAGSINEEGAFEFESTSGASDTQFARIIQMVEEAQARRAPSEQWVERFARIYTPAMLVLATLVAVLPPLLFGQSWGHWLYQALVLLVIACPCALVISTPVSVVAGLATAARAGVLVKGGVHLESPARLNAIAMDKTGTITQGLPTVQEIVPLNGHSSRDVLGVAASLEANSAHPLARAVMKRAGADEIDLLPVEDFQSLTGRGAEGTIEHQRYWIGSHRLLEERAGRSAEVHAIADRLESTGSSLIAVGRLDEPYGLLAIADPIRADAKNVVRDLKRLGISRVVMLTGDNERVAASVASEVGVDEYRSELLPQDKVAAINELVAAYGRVAMVGDGVNDAPALASSQLGVAMGAMGTAAAVETADVALMSDDLTRLTWLVRHSRRTVRTIQQNILFALGLKAVFVVLALLGVATLWMAIAADMGASLLVIFNGLRLLKDPEVASVTPGVAIQAPLDKSPQLVTLEQSFT